MISSIPIKPLLASLFTEVRTLKTFLLRSSWSENSTQNLGNQRHWQSEAFIIHLEGRSEHFKMLAV